MVGRTLLVGSLLLGAISATPVAVPATGTVTGSEAAPLLTRSNAASSSVDHKIDTIALWTREWYGLGAAPVIATRDLDANNVIDKVAGWTKDWYHTEDANPATKRDVDTNDVVDTMAAWTKEWVHTGESAQKRAAPQEGESVDDTIDRVAGKVKNYFQQGGSLAARDLGIDLSSIFHTIIGWLEGLDWNSIIKTVTGWLANVNWNAMIKGILSWIDSTFFGGSSSAPAPTASAAAHVVNVAARDSGIDWSMILQKGLQWVETLL